MYLLVAIEITSLLRHRMSKRVWHSIHLLSYLLFAMTTVHLLTAGTDAKAIFTTTAAVLIGTAVTFGSVAMYLWRTNPPEPKEPPRAARVPARTPSHSPG
jgi:DMSO/TMAO reductase YedYZ heme-binding membrane subunit